MASSVTVFKVATLPLYLPKYSPDRNPVEHVFANLKQRRQHAPQGTTLDELVRTYENYLV